MFKVQPGFHSDNCRKGDEQTFRGEVAPHLLVFRLSCEIQAEQYLLQSKGFLRIGL